MIWNERVISTAIARQVFSRRCILLVDHCQWTGHECDVLAVTRCLRIIDIEIKISRADLRADAAKDKWWRRLGFNGKAEQRQWPPHVWKHYYAMPAEIWKPELIQDLPAASGVILLRSVFGDTGIVAAGVERRAKPNSEAKPITAANVIDIARLANLRMWDAYSSLARETAHA